MFILENQKPWEFEAYNPEKHGTWDEYQIAKFEDYIAWKEIHGDDLSGASKAG